MLGPAISRTQSLKTRSLPLPLHCHFLLPDQGVQAGARLFVRGRVGQQDEPNLRDLAQPRTFKLLAQRKRIVKLGQVIQHHGGVATHRIINIIAMDFDPNTDCVFWTFIDMDKIMKQCLSNWSLP